jgi:dsDNA-binding SOS-regulon protein
MRIQWPIPEDVLREFFKMLAELRRKLLADGPLDLDREDREYLAECLAEQEAAMLEVQQKHRKP